MSDVTLFKGKFNMPVLPTGFDDPVTDLISGGSSGGGGGRRVSIRGGRFRMVVDGKEIMVSEDNAMDVVIVSAAPVSRMYYESTYKEGEIVAPTCWSSDTQSPDARVPAEQRQASRCADCAMNIKGSGQGDTRACRYQQKVAVVLGGEIEDRVVYQLQLPATSVFGEAEGNNMPLQAYGRYLRANSANVIAVMTRMKFDVNATTPKLFFRAVRPLTQEELDICLELRDLPETAAAIALNAAEVDRKGVIASDAPKASAKPAAKPAAKSKPVVEDDDDEVVAPAAKPAAKAPVFELEDDDEEEEVAPPPRKKKTPAVEAEDDDVAEPTVTKPKRSAAVAEAKPLASMLEDWDD